MSGGSSPTTHPEVETAYRQILGLRRRNPWLVDAVIATAEVANEHLVVHAAARRATLVRASAWCSTWPTPSVRRPSPGGGPRVVVPTDRCGRPGARLGRARAQPTLGTDETDDLGVHRRIAEQSAVAEPFRGDESGVRPPVDELHAPGPGQRRSSRSDDQQGGVRACSAMLAARTPRPAFRHAFQGGVQTVAGPSPEVQPRRRTGRDSCAARASGPRTPAAPPTAGCRAASAWSPSRPSSGPPPRASGSVTGGDGRQRVGELDRMAAARSGRARVGPTVAGSVEGHHSMAGRHQRSDQRASRRLSPAQP